MKMLGCVESHKVQHTVPLPNKAQLPITSRALNFLLGYAWRERRSHWGKSVKLLRANHAIDCAPSWRFVRLRGSQAEGQPWAQSSTQMAGCTEKDGMTQIITATTDYFAHLWSTAPFLCSAEYSTISIATLIPYPTKGTPAVDHPATTQHE